jgi:hypothetical protein
MMKKVFISKKSAEKRVTFLEDTISKMQSRWDADLNDVMFKDIDLACTINIQGSSQLFSDRGFIVGELLSCYDRKRDILHEIAEINRKLRKLQGNYGSHESTELFFQILELEEKKYELVKEYHLKLNSSLARFERHVRRIKRLILTGLGAIVERFSIRLLRKHLKLSYKNSEEDGLAAILVSNSSFKTIILNNFYDNGSRSFNRKNKYHFNLQWA